MMSVKIQKLVFGKMGWQIQEQIAVQMLNIIIVDVGRTLQCAIMSAQSGI